jgi:hypothetical protein
MPLCPECQQWYEVSRAAAGCPRCTALASGSAPAANQQGELPPLARFRNWAEAGFFEDLLHSHGIAAQLEPHEQFDAVGGHWGHQLLLRVPAADFDRARALVQGELDEGAEESPARGSYLADDVYDADREQAVGSGAVRRERVDEGPPLWKPLAVVLVAGGLAYLGTHGLRWARPRPPAALDARPAARSSDLWRYLTDHGGMWERVAGDGAVHARMWHDRRSGTLHIEEDRDGDGDFERDLQFELGRKREPRQAAPAQAAAKD